MRAVSYSKGPAGFVDISFRGIRDPASDTETSQDDLE